MGDSEIKRISGREGWSDEAHEEHGPTLKQKVPEKNMWTSAGNLLKFCCRASTEYQKAVLD